MISRQPAPAIKFLFAGKPFRFDNRKAVKHILRTLFNNERRHLQLLSYIFCKDAYLLDINRKYLRHDNLTDIITFDLSEKDKAGIIGEIYISTERVRENAITFDTSFRTEMVRVIFHGALHLCGFRDKTLKEKRVMRAMEDKYLLFYERLVVPRGT